MAKTRHIFIGAREREIATRTFRGIEVTFTEDRWKDRGRDCVTIGAYSTKDGWSGGGAIAYIYHVDGGYVAVHPYDHRPMFCRDDAAEIVAAVLNNYKGPS
jgi:hypothetical protein